MTGWAVQFASLPVAAALLGTVGGCGYAGSGTYDDDPRAWMWAFDQPEPPPGVTVNRSRYWSSPHFTAEYVWHFDLGLDAAAVAAVRTDPEFVRDERDRPVADDQPDWFLPAGPAGYEIYRSKDLPPMWIYLDPESGRSFWTKTQL